MALGAAWAHGQATPNDSPPTFVLDTLSVWRIHGTLQPPVLQLDNGLKPVTSKYQWLDRETAAPPEDWTDPSSPTATGCAGVARAASRTPYLAQVCLRARFKGDRAGAGAGPPPLAHYYGGAIVYLNGRELVRGHVAREGPPGLADGYPPAAFVTDNGKMLPAADWQMDRYPKALAVRARTLAEVAIPATLLRKGVNVLGIQIVRAPYHKILDAKKNQAADKRELATRNCPYELAWNTCEVRRVQLTAAGAAGLVPNASRRRGSRPGTPTS